MLAAGDRAGADRALDYMLRVQQRPDGHLPQNTRVDGTPYWTSVQLDEIAAPMLLAGLLDRTDKSTLDGLRRAAEFLVNYRKDGNTAPWSEQERWENHSGYSPATIASAVAGLVCLADLLQRAGDTAGAQRYLTIADRWQSTVDKWTATSTGPLSDRPYYLRLTKDGQPDRGTTYDLGDNNPGQIDQRAVVDPSFLELVRLGVKPATDPIIRNTLTVIDKHLATTTPAGRFWHRFTSDGYGERADGGPWNVDQPTPHRTYGRLWPIFAGERGEYDLLTGDRRSATRALQAIAARRAARACSPSKCGTTAPPPQTAHVPAQPPPQRRHWRGPTPSTSAWPGRSTPAARSNNPRWSPAATPPPAERPHHGGGRHIREKRAPPVRSIPGRGEGPRRRCFS